VAALSLLAHSLSAKLSLASFLFLLPVLLAEPSPQVPDGDSVVDLQEIELVSTVDQFQKSCANMLGEPRKFEACRRKLVLFRSSYLWIDRDFLLQDGERLKLDHLNFLHGFSAAGSEPSLLAVTGVIASWCRAKGHRPARRFEELDEAGCLSSLPTLAEMGLEIDRHGSGLRTVDSTYDATHRTTWVSEPKSKKGVAWSPRPKGSPQ